MRVPTFVGEGDRYRIEGEIGKGGMGSVYRAQDKNTGKLVAIKVLTEGSNTELFDKETSILAELQHPNIIGITDRGNFRDGATKIPFFVMPFLKGHTLAQRIQGEGGPLSMAEIVEIISAAAGSLQAAHERGVIHRDIKPTNIFVLESGPVVVIDFGVVHLVGNSEGTTVKGTIPYMAPELLVPTKNERPAPVSDLFSLGVVCYEALTGKHPFARETNWETRQAILHEIPVPAFELNQNLSLVLSQVVQKAMAKDPKHRFTSVKEFAEKLERAYRSEPLPEFERNVIENKLRVVRDALSRGQPTSADEMMRSIEEDGFIDPAITNQREKIDRALLQKWISEQIESAKMYRDADQDFAALEKLNAVLRKVPDNVDALRERESIQEGRYNKLLEDARSLMAQQLYADARISIQDATAIRPFDVEAAALLDEVTNLEIADRQFSERKSALYQDAQRAQRDGHPLTALRNLEQLMEMIRQSPLSSPERDPIYKSLYDVMVEENDRLEKASQEVRSLLSVSGKEADAILICEQMLGANPGNPLFESLRLEAENQEQQTRMNFINRIRADLDLVQDLDARVKILQDAVEHYPNETQLMGLLRSARVKRDFVNGLATRARNAEVPGRYSVALELWHDVQKCHPAFANLDAEIQRVEKLQEEEAREETRVRLVQEVVKLLRAGEFENAEVRSAAALAEFPADAELLAYHLEAKQSALRAPEVQRLVLEGKRLWQEGSTDAALDVLRRAVNMNRNNPQVRRLLGVIVIEKAKGARAAGDLAVANKLFKEAQTLIPEHPDVKSGIAQYRNKDQGETVEECLAAVALLSESKDFSGALTQIEKTLKVFSGDSRLLEAQTRIRKMQRQATPGDATVLEQEPGDFTSLEDEPAPKNDKKPGDETLDQEETPVSKPVLAKFQNLADRIRVFRATQIPAARKKWMELKPQHKGIYAIALVLVLSIGGFGAYRILKGHSEKGFAVATPVTLPVDIRSSPEGADIIVDGQKAGISKIRQELKPGDHEIEVSLAGYETKKEKFTLVSGPLLNHVVTLAPLPMDLQIITPANIQGKVWLDNEAKVDLAGPGGTLVSGISSGQHELKIEAPGRESITATIVLSPGNPPRTNAKTPKEKAIFLFMGSFGGKLWAECSCPSGSKLTLGDLAQPVDAAGVEMNRPESDQPLVFSALGLDGGKFTFPMSMNPGATLALYNWASLQPKTIPLADQVESLYRSADEAYRKGELTKAQALVQQALPDANAAQKEKLAVLGKAIDRDRKLNPSQ